MSDLDRIDNPIEIAMTTLARSSFLQGTIAPNLCQTHRPTGFEIAPTPLKLSDTEDIKQTHFSTAHT